MMFKYLEINKYRDNTFCAMVLGFLKLSGKKERKKINSKRS